VTETQFASGYFEFWVAWRWLNAIAHFRRAAEIDPSNALAHMLAGHVLSQLGEHVEARAMMQRARELDPLFPMTYSLSSQVAFQARDFADAREFAQQAIAINPQFWIGYMHLGQVLEQLGERDAAIAALEKSIRLSGGNSKPTALRAYALARMGHIQEARAALDQLKKKAEQAYVPPYAFALIHAGLGDEDETRLWLERSLAARDVHLVFLPVDPKWDALRDRPWFESLLERCAFAPAPTARQRRL
jgi:tetratricopeptide (TPR) repeat protein